MLAIESENSYRYMYREMCEYVFTTNIVVTVIKIIKKLYLKKFLGQFYKYDH